MIRRSLWGALVTFHLVSAQAFAAERYALVVTGASGGAEYAAKYKEWRETFSNLLQSKFGYPADHVRLLSDDGARGAGPATREGVRQALEDLRRRARIDDLVVILLVGHGSAGDSPREAKFNLVGPDLTAGEWAALVKPIAGRVVFINAASGSFPFLATLAGFGRVVLTATDSAAQEYETLFPEYFVDAFEDPAADLDKNGRVSIWEAFLYASTSVREAYAQKGRLATERPLLDDTGHGVGREAQMPGGDGRVAATVYLQPEIPSGEGDPKTRALRARRAELERDLDALKARKNELRPEDYERRLEELLLEIAGVDREIRTKSSGT